MIHMRNATHAQATATMLDCWSFSWENHNFLELSLPVVGFEPTTFRGHAEYTYVYKHMHRYICVGFCDITI